MPSSYTATMAAEIILDTGSISADLTTPGTLELIGGTRGGFSFDPGAEIRNVEYDGKRANVAELDRITMYKPSFTGTIITANSKLIRFLHAGATGTGTTITPPEAGTMFVAAQYHKWALVFKRGDASTVTITFPYALVTSYTVGGQDNNEGEISVTIEARQLRSDGGSTDGEVPFTIVPST